MTITQIPRSTPEEQGVSSAAVLKFLKAVDKQIHGIHSFMLLRHGVVVAEGWWSPYAPGYPHMLFSLSKSFTSTAIGLAVAEGRLSVDDRVLSFFPEQAPAEPDDNLKAMCVRHLLSMSTGHAKDTTERMTMRRDRDWVKGFLALPVENTPGAPFVYNSGASYMLSAIVQKVTGMKMVDYLKPRLFEPLGIEQFDWETCPKGINTGGWGLSLKTEDIARFGQLYLQKGLWDGKQILPSFWVEQATAKQVSNGDDPNSDWAQGYGFQFWRCRFGFYRGDGAFGQYCMVIPEKDAVLAITAGIDDMQSVLNLVCDDLLYAFEKGSLPADPAASKALKKKLARLSLPLPTGISQPRIAAQVSGKTFIFEPNEQKIKSVTFDFSEQGNTLTIQAGRRKHRVSCGVEKWLDGAGPGLGPRFLRFGDLSLPVKASGAWKTEDTYLVTMHFIETPFCQTMTCHFTGEQVEIASAVNVSFYGPKEMAPLVGKRV